ncbi:hypothetical protein ES705_21980 [subsurface metagenome]
MSYFTSEWKPSGHNRTRMFYHSCQDRRQNVFVSKCRDVLTKNAKKTRLSLVVSYTIADREGALPVPPTLHPEGRVSSPDKRRFHITDGLLIRRTLSAYRSSGALCKPIVGPAFMVCGLPGTPNTQRMSLIVTGDEQRTRRG